MIPEVFAVAREAMDRAVGIQEHLQSSTLAVRSQSAVLTRRDALYEASAGRTIEANEDRASPDRRPARGIVAKTCARVVVRGHSSPALYEAVREPSSLFRSPRFRARPFDVQIIGAIVLYEGRIAEMKTGEGKTIVAPLACYLCGTLLESRCMSLRSMTTSCSVTGTGHSPSFTGSWIASRCAIHPACTCNLASGQAGDVSCATSSMEQPPSSGFDFLRDNMKLSVQEQVQHRPEPGDRRRG